ncbi:MAG: hypothetical protein OCD76_19000 [Reichenbachiella sp.]
MKTNVKELVIYTIKEQYKSEYKKVQSVVKSCLQDMTGYQSVLSYRSCSIDNQLMDWVNWDTLDNAKQAQKKFESHPQYDVLLSYLDTMTFSDHFKN